MTVIDDMKKPKIKKNIERQLSEMHRATVGFSMPGRLAVNATLARMGERVEEYRKDQFNTLMEQAQPRTQGPFR